MRVEDLGLIEVEHQLGGGSDGVFRPEVKIRCVGATNTILLGMVDPDEARQLAADLNLMAARAEYEKDLFEGLSSAGIEPGIIAGVITAVRGGEIRRYEGDLDG